jgi:hypothetical protein
MHSFTSILLGLRHGGSLPPYDCSTDLSVIRHRDMTDLAVPAYQSRPSLLSWIQRGNADCPAVSSLSITCSKHRAKIDILFYLLIFLSARMRLTQSGQHLTWMSLAIQITAFGPSMSRGIPYIGRHYTIQNKDVKDNYHFIY